VINCTKCDKPVSVAFTCSVEGEVTLYCADDFASTPCGLGLHRADCMVSTLGDRKGTNGCRDYTSGSHHGLATSPEILSKAIANSFRQHTTHMLNISVGRNRIQSIIGGLFELRLRLDHTQSNWARYAGTLSNRRTSPDELNVKLADGRVVRFVIEENR
jgi:hypothetical protein